MKKAHFIVLIFLVLTFCSNGQESSNYIGFGMSFGYKSNYSTAAVSGQARLFKHIDLDLAGSYSFINGFGYSGGINLVPLNTKFQPFIGVAYSKHFGTKFNVDDKEALNTSFYQISAIEYVYSKIGIIYSLEKEEGDFADLGFLTLTLSYRKAISDYSIELVQGPEYKKGEDLLNSRMTNGIGFSISVVFLFGGK